MVTVTGLYFIVRDRQLHKVSTLNDGQYGESSTPVDEAVNLDLSYLRMGLDTLYITNEDPDVDMSITLGSFCSLKAEQLVLKGLHLRGIEVSCLGGSRIRELIIVDCSFDVIVTLSMLIYRLRGSTNLRKLTLQNCAITGTVPSYISILYSLEELVLSDCPIEGELPESILDLQYLRVLDISGTDIDIPQDILDELELSVQLYY